MNYKVKTVAPFLVNTGDDALAIRDYTRKQLADQAENLLARTAHTLKDNTVSRRSPTRASVR